MKDYPAPLAEVPMTVSTLETVALVCFGDQCVIRSIEQLRALRRDITQALNILDPRPFRGWARENVDRNTQILALRDDGLGQQAIANELGLDRHVVSGVLHRARKADARAA